MTLLYKQIALTWGIAMMGCMATALAQGVTFTNCAELPICTSTSNCTEAQVDVTAEATTTCGNPTLNFTYKIDYGNNGSIDLQGNGATVSQVFPLGISKISWRANSGCGQVATCDQIVKVSDCFPPNLVCRNGITQSLDAACQMVVSAQQFVLSISDNCTPTNQLVYGIRKAGTGTGFPPHDTIQYNHCDQGTNIIQVWVKDAAGNTNQCSNYVLVQDNSNQCPCIQSTDIKLTGCARTANGTKLNSYRITAKANGTITGNIPAFTSKTTNFQDSCFTLSLSALPINFTGQTVVSASRVDFTTSGVTPYDLILISRHILNLEPMTSIYQILAADVNRSQTVTTFDIVEIRKALLGTVDTFPQVPSWQFIRPVADPSQLVNFAAVKDTFVFNYSNASGAVTNGGMNFIGIKSGDIDYTTNLVGGSLASDRNGPVLPLIGQDQWVEAGSTVDVPIFPSESARLSAWQLHLQPQQGSVTVLGVQGLRPDNYALQPDGGIRVLWMDEQPGQALDFPATQPLATLQVQAHRAGWLSQLLTATDQPAEAITAGVMVRPIAFNWAKATPQGQSTQVFQPSPNPTSDGLVRWPIQLAQAGTVRLDITSAAGQWLTTQSTTLGEGYQVLDANLSTLPTGWYGWRVTAGETSTAGMLFKR